MIAIRADGQVLGRTLRRQWHVNAGGAMNRWIQNDQDLRAIVYVFASMATQNVGLGGVLAWALDLST